jgi:zinc D-Ala-D-Ala carboxypeptidase
MKLTAHFDNLEFACSCCSEVEMSEGFLNRLEAARVIADTPFKITSGYRCAINNRRVGGVSTSAHLVGKAADISANGSIERFSIIRALLYAGFVRIGIGKSYIHVDNDESKPAGVMWNYYD